MAEIRLVDTRGTDFSEDTRFPGIGVKLLEGKAVNPTLSMVLVRVEPGRGIPTHTHPVETETALFTAGMAILTVEGVEHVLEAGMCVTIPPGLAHSLRNGGEDASVLIDATLKEGFPPISLPKRQHKESAKALWEELGLPRLKPEAPWYGYSLGEWPSELDEAAERATRGEYFAYGKELEKRRRKDVPMNTEVRRVKSKKKRQSQGPP